jgi:hypothetical protein
MPRPLRIEYEGACYHVMSRGYSHRDRDGRGDGYGHRHRHPGISGEHPYVQS